MKRKSLDIVLCVCACLPVRQAFVIILLLFPLYSNAQTLSTKSKRAIDYYSQADNFRVRGQLTEAIALLNQAIEKDRKFEEAHFRLGLTYRSAGELNKSNQSLENGMALTTNPIKLKNYFYLLAEGFLRVGNYSKSLALATRFLTSEKFDKKKILQVEVWKKQSQYSLDNADRKFDYQIKPLSDTVNSFPTQYFPTITPDENELIFTVSFGMTASDNEEIFITKKSENGSWGKPIPISNQINTNFREGASTISADGRLLIFTICGYQGCDLYQSTKLGSYWSKPASLGTNVNSNGWDAQPALSADGNLLFFVSSRSGGLGGYDIWYSTRNEDGTWAKAVNAGKTINTAFDELAPFIHSNGLNLYFASNGLPGFGGYDIYMSERVDFGWKDPINLGQPLNDFTDQYSFVVNGKGDFAYYSKEQGKGSKIYSTTIPAQLQIKRKSNIVRGIVVDATTKNPLKAKIELHDLSANKFISTFTSDSTSGSYLFVLPSQSDYAVHANSAGYLFASLNFNVADETSEKIVNLELPPIAKNAEVTLKNIFFEFDKYELSEKSTVELEEVRNFLKVNPMLRVEIGGHSDNVGSEKYNQQLSEKRAQEVFNHLILSGIPKTQLAFKGYGSSKPVANNNSEESRALNRRISFIIL